MSDTDWMWCYENPKTSAKLIDSLNAKAETAEAMVQTLSEKLLHADTMVQSLLSTNKKAEAKVKDISDWLNKLYEVRNEPDKLIIMIMNQKKALKDTP
jgi:hypothetical protein